MTTLPAKLRAGVDLIDREHERLLELESRLTQFCPDPGTPCNICEAPTQLQCAQVLDHLFTELLEFMAEHFEHEEGLMIGLPAEITRAHKFEHAEISRRFSSLVKANRQRAMLVTPAELDSIVTHWLGQHIEHWDIPLARQITTGSGNAWRA